MAEEKKSDAEEPREAEEKQEEPKVKPEKKAVAKPREEKPQKAKKERKGVFSYYKIDETGLERLRPFCERCGSGYFMADHKNRFTCGHCGFTQYKHNEAASNADKTLQPSTD
ncbi:MAG: 30S ribosomal protein S27ae [Candidatus Bathyarchaeota archaeon]|nr:MAG: 30S ribosomal protein S27ae [Candidatus Bathyarchaeota archaeon]